MSNPDVPLGSAEQFLLTLTSVNELVPRLHLWAFKLDYDQLERVGNKSSYKVIFVVQAADRFFGDVRCVHNTFSVFVVPSVYSFLCVRACVRACVCLCVRARSEGVN